MLSMEPFPFFFCNQNGVVSGRIRHELFQEICYLSPKGSDKNKEHGSFSTAVLKAKEQQKSDQEVFQTDQVARLLT